MKFSLLTKAGVVVYYVVTMSLQSHHPLFHQAATLFSVAQPLMAVSQKPLCQAVANLHPGTILRELYLRAAQVLDNTEPQNEAEQSIEKAWLTEAQKANLSNLLKIKDRV
jgi:hypothetical protein